MEIYYFSGTGNSLHVARELKQRFPEATLIPIIRALKKKTIRTEAAMVGIIFPIHALTLPWPVEEFLGKLETSPATYLFAVATRMCFARVFHKINRLMKKQGMTLDAYFSFEMPETYIPVFQVYSIEKIREVESEVKKKLAFIEKTLAGKEKHLPKDPGGWFLVSHIIYPLITQYFRKIRFPDMEKSFYADQECTGCGICEDICLSGKIQMKNGKPHWQSNIPCTYCFACIHFCPARAIQIKRRNTIKKGRYHHPSIKAADIMEQKEMHSVPE